MHVLLIEPDKILGRLYAQALERAGHTVDHVRSAQTAIVAADERRPDVVVTEMQLATHSGAAFLYEFRSYSDWMDIPVMIHTLVPPTRLAAFTRAFKELGVSAQLYKPQTSLRQLVTAVQETSTAVV